MDDLKNGIIRTPLPPKETFNDDPLRIIRCVRFASRFGFNMVPELKEAVLDPTIQVGTSVLPSSSISWNADVRQGGFVSQNQ